MATASDIVIFPVKWMRLEAYCAASGEAQEVVRKRIRDGEWAAGMHYKRTNPRTAWINLQEVTKWIEKQPHVEAYCPKASKSAKANAKAA